MKKISYSLSILAICAGMLTSCGKSDEPQDPTEKDPTEQPGENPGEDPGEEPGEDPGEDPEEELSTLEGSEYEYSVNSKGLHNTGQFKSGFYQKNDWEDGCTVTYSVSDLHSYIDLGNSMNIEIYAGAAELLNGKAFDIATTEYPFSIRFEYVNMEAGNTIVTTIDNTNREGATGTVAFLRNAEGKYDTTFDISLNQGDITIKGHYAEELQNRNTLYASDEGIIGEVKSATLDMSGKSYVLYLSTNEGEAGPSNYTVKGEVPSEEWILGKYMAFGGQGSSLTWIDGIVYNSNSYPTTPFFGGNWRVYELIDLPDGSNAGECRMMLFSDKVTRYAYYYGKMKVIK